MEGSRPGDGGIFIFLSDKITKRIYSWQSRFKEYVRMPKPHLTLMYPPFITVDEWNIKRKDISDIAKTFSPFEIDFTKTGYFKDPFFLYFAPEGQTQLEDMNLKLAEIMRDNLSGLNLEPFIPHVSIGTFATEESTLEAEKQLQGLMGVTDLKFTVKEIFFTALGDDLRWKIHDIISLGS